MEDSVKKTTTLISMQTTVAFRGILALAVVFTHLGLYSGGEDSSFLLRGLFAVWGHIAVTCFFLFAGFGLSVSVLKKEGYVKSFPRRRILPMVLFLLIMCAIYALWKLVWLHALSLDEFVFPYSIGLLEVTGFGYGWFIVVLVVLYLLFWLVNRFTDGRSAYLVIAVALYIAVSIVLNLRRDLYLYTPGFAIGYLYARDPEVLRKPYEKHKAAWLIGLSVVAVAGFFLKSGNVLRWFFKGLESTNYLVTLFGLLSMIAISFLLVWMLHVLSIKIETYPSFLNWIGMYSFGIYVAHGLFINLRRWDIITNLALYIVLTIVGTALLMTPFQKLYLLIEKACAGTKKEAVQQKRLQ